MKKLYSLLIASVLVTGSMFAQQTAPTSLNPGTNLRPGFQPQLNPNKPISPNKFKSSQTMSTESYWLNYAYTMDSLNGNLSELNSNYLFWDSTALGYYGTVYDYNWLQHLGNILDVQSDNFMFTDNINWNNYNSYTCDSMELIYAYTRNHPNPNVVDTLIVWLYHNGTVANTPTYYFAGSTWLTNFGDDTVRFKAQKYIYATNEPDAVGKTAIKIPLTIADTAVTFYRAKAFNTNSFSVPSGKLLASSITFKPGYTWSLGDTLDTELNAFFFTSYEENGAGTYSSYTTPCYNSGFGCDHNVSSIIRTNERHNVNPWSGGGLFIPHYAFTQPYSLERHLISYKVTSGNVGINEENDANMSLHQNQPNPFNGTTTVNYELASTVGSVSLVVYDVTGKQVMAYDKGKQAAGLYTITIDGSNLEAGVYFYTLVADGNKVTNKMTVIK